MSFGSFGPTIMGGLFISLTGRPHLYQRNKKLVNLFCYVFYLCIVQSFIWLLFNGMEFKYFSRGVSTSLNAIIFILLSFRICEMYGRRVLDYLVTGYVIAYFFVIITAIPLFGISAIYNSLFSITAEGLSAGGGGNDCESYLEQSHSFLLIAPFLSLVYFYEFYYTKKTSLIYMALILILMSLVAYKRIAIGAALILSSIFLFKRIYGKTFVIISGVICIAFLFLYIFLIHSDLIFFFAKEYEINLMFRDVLWPEFHHLYDFDVSFMGQGWEFTSKYLHENNVKLTGVEIGGLHNDILKIYIDLGFIGTIVYFGIFLIWIPIKLLRMRHKESSFLWFSSQIYLIIIYLTDNAMIYGACQIAVYTLTISKIDRQTLIQ